MVSNFITRNSTPTFELQPAEKPDMSPYLFHLTTGENLIGILSEDIIKRKGKIKGNIPRGSENSFDYEIVCFTESPIFALDFFRYRWSENRDRLNLNYGIGFSKKNAVIRGVYPTIYASMELNKNIKSIFNKLGELKELQKIINKDLLDKIIDTKKRILPLLTPLFEKSYLQGFMWEREWRIEGDFEFDYDDIKYICCPKEAKDRIINIVGTKNIKFLENWEEYNEIIEFIKVKEKPSTLSNENILLENKNIEKKINYYKNLLGSLDDLKNFQVEIEKEIQARDRLTRQKVIKKVKEWFTNGEAKEIDNIILSSEISIDIIINNVYFLHFMKPQSSKSDFISTKDADYSLNINSNDINTLEEFIKNNQFSQCIVNNELSDNFIEHIENKRIEQIKKLEEKIRRELHPEENIEIADFSS